MVLSRPDGDAEVRVRAVADDGVRKGVVVLPYGWGHLPGAVGAGEGELVLLVQGSSARQTTMTDGSPVDCAIFAIVDTIEKDRKIVFQKSKDKARV